MVAPQAAVPGQGTAVLVYLGTPEPANITLRLMTGQGTRELIAHNTITIQGWYPLITRIKIF